MNEYLLFSQKKKKLIYQIALCLGTVWSSLDQTDFQEVLNIKNCLVFMSKIYR
jgi:hypothetical protein